MGSSIGSDNPISENLPYEGVLRDQMRDVVVADVAGSSGSILPRLFLSALHIKLFFCPCGLNAP